MKSAGFHHEIRCFSKNSSDFTRFGVDFMKSTGFHMKSAGFHEICRISYGFHEIRRISCEIERPLQGIVTLCFLSFPEIKIIQMYVYCDVVNVLMNNEVD